ncbi:MAG: hypothetical protein HYW25_03045 [Candidatus Aenigmarchaeota archaeon]|nr:hypothetical protein [Candidatus Aenigmarchaeota archaeon]
MANPFEIMVSNLNELGFFGFLLPWIFIFAITFGILAKTKVLGDDMRVSAVVSIVLGFFVVGFGGPFLADFFVNIFGIAAMVIAGILVLVLFMGMTGMSLEKIGDNKAVLVFFIGLAILIFFVALGGLFVRFTDDAAAIVLIIIVFAAAVAFITGAGNKKD